MSLYVPCVAMTRQPVNSKCVMDPAVHSVSQVVQTCLKSTPKPAVDEFKKIRMLLMPGAKVDVKDLSGFTAFGRLCLLKVALQKDRWDIINILVEEGRIDINTVIEGNSLLNWAIIKRQVGVADQLIDEGANIKYKDKNGFTALNHAMHQNQPALAKKLVNAGMDESKRINLIFLPGRTLDLNEIRNFSGFGRFCLLQEAVSKGRWDIVKFLVENGLVDVNSVIQGNSLLNRAIIGKQFDVVEQLIERGANVKFKDKRGFTALHEAMAFNKPELVEKLIKAGADVNAQNNLGEAPLHFAYARMLIPVVQKLLKNGAKWDLSTGYELSERRLLAAVWGTGKEMLSRRTRAHFVISQALCEYITRNPAHNISNPEEVITALLMRDEFNIDARLSKIQRGEGVCIRGGYIPHAITLIFYKGYLAICNRGLWGPTKLYKIDPSQMTKELLNTINGFLNSEDTTTAQKFVYEELPKYLHGVDRALYREPLQKNQKGPFCIYDSPEAALFTILALQKVFDPKVEIENAVKEGKQVYKGCTTFFRLHFLQKYIDQIKSGRIKKERVDWILLKEIHKRLSNPEWHPERFASEFHKNLKINVLKQLEEILKIKGA